MQTSKGPKSHRQYSYMPHENVSEIQNEENMEEYDGSFQHTSVQKPNLGNLRKMYSFEDPDSALVSSLDSSSVREYGIMGEDSMMA